jgi:glutamate-1-semialdehyde 2,1-aminomutase
MPSFTRSKAILAKHINYIPGSVASVNRIASPEITFVKAYMWNADGNRYIDYRAAFAPHFLGHNDPHVTQAVNRVLQQGASLYGSGTTLRDN